MGENICMLFICYINRYIRKKTKSNSNHKWAINLKRSFTKEEIQMPNKCILKCSTPLVIMKMQIKAAVKCHHSNQNGCYLKKKKEISADRDTEKKKELLHTHC